MTLRSIYYDWHYTFKNVMNNIVFIVPLQMDFAAVRMASDKDFQALGLRRRGDILALRSFVLNDVDGHDTEKEGRKRKLLELQKQLDSKSTKKKAVIRRRQSSEDVSPLPTQRSKKIQIGWMHFNDKEKRFVAVRMAKGGGTREVSFPLQATSGELIAVMKDVFFPDGMSAFGRTNQMTFKLGNFRCEEIKEEFTLDTYITKHRLTKVRLYTLSKVSIRDKLEKKSEVHSPSDDDSDLLTSVFENKQDTSSGLLGCSEDRKSLRALQEKEYLDSLAKDQEKVREKRKELLRCQEKTARQESLRESRANRVSDEPQANDPHITVSVRHPILGVQTRRFDKSGEVGNIYDWVGSLSLEPEYFTLSMPESANLSPSLPIETVDRVMLSMSECEETPPFPDEDVCFQGFGAAPKERFSSTTKFEDISGEPFCVSEKPPHVLMEGDEV